MKWPDYFCYHLFFRIASIISTLLVFQTEVIPDPVTMNRDRSKQYRIIQGEKANKASSMRALLPRTIRSEKSRDRRKIYNPVPSISKPTRRSTSLPVRPSAFRIPTSFFLLLFLK